MNFSQSTFFNIIASIGLMFINVITGVISARILGPEELGRFNLFLTTQTIFITIFALGIGQSCIYFINSLKIDKKIILSTSVNAMLPFSVISSSFFFLILFHFGNMFGSVKIVYLILFTIGTNALLITNIFVPILHAEMQVVKNQTVAYSARVITLVLILGILLLKLKLTIGVLIAITGITNVISLLILYSYFKNHFSFTHKIDMNLFKRLLKWGLKLSGNNISSLILTSLPVYFLSWLSVSDKLANVGYYSRATSLLVVGIIIASSIGPLLFAKWSSLKDTDLKNQVKKISMPLLVINFLLAISLIIFSSLVIEFLYGKPFLSAVPVLRILALTLVFNGLREICYGILSSQGVPLKILKNLVISIILLVLMLWVFIPNYGLIGCAWGTLIVSGVSAYLLMIDSMRISLLRFSDFFVLPTKKDVMGLLINLKQK